MSLYLYTRPINSSSSLFDDIFDDDFFNALTPRCSFGGSCHARRHHHRNHYPSLDKQLSQFFNNENHFKWVDFAPKINISEDEKHYYIHADLPGLNKDQVKMELDEDHILTISGKREYTYHNNNEATEKGKEEENEMETEQTEQADQAEQPAQPEKTQEQTQEENKSVNDDETEKDTGKYFSVKECNYGSFSRSFRLPEDANIENIQAKMENGVLEVTINKMEPPKPQNRTIQIQ